MLESRTLGKRLHRGYYLLAVFEIVTVAGALYLAHRMTAMFDESLAANQAWQQRVRAYSAIDESLTDVRPPLDELFVSEDLAGERRRFASALATFDRLTATARQEALQGIEGEARSLIQKDFDEIDRARAVMAQEAARVFEAFTPEHTDRAARMLGLAEQYLLSLRKATVKLQDDAIASSVRTLEAQEQAAEALRGSETVVGLSIVVMVIAATLYGRRISIRMQAADEERDRHLAAIRENENVLRQTEERLQLAGRATNDALWDWELGPDVVWWNDAFATLFARSGEFPSLETLNALIHPDDRDRVARSLRQFLSSPSDVWTAEYRVRRADGAYAWVLDRGYAIREADGTARRMVSSMMDITERKDAERMKSDFVSFVSHQLRTPLSGMSWMLELAADSEGLPELAHEYIIDARASASRLSTLVNDLLDIARLESGRLVAVPEPLSLPALTTAVVAELQPLASEKALAVDVLCDAGTHRVSADPQLMRQVVTNLLSNAVKYTPRGGKISVGVVQHDSSVTWSVTDTGVGVPKEAQPRLFEKFYRAGNAVAMETEGTGLGLHLVRLIVEQAGGRAWCESEEGQGATFAFTLPAIAIEKEVT